jgi:hypothetical protein
MEPARLQELTDEELDAVILTRLKSFGVDLSVLPEDDPDAPADRGRIMAGARRFLRSTPQAIMAWEPDPQKVAPEMYPAAQGPALRERAR